MVCSDDACGAGTLEATPSGRCVEERLAPVQRQSSRIVLEQQRSERSACECSWLARPASHRPSLSRSLVPQKRRAEARQAAKLAIPVDPTLLERETGVLWDNKYVMQCSGDPPLPCGLPILTCLVTGSQTCLMMATVACMPFGLD